MRHLCLAGGSSSDLVVKDFHDALARSPDTAVAVAAIKVSSAVSPPNCACGRLDAYMGAWQRPEQLAEEGQTFCFPFCLPLALAAEPQEPKPQCFPQALTAVIERSKETTMMGIERELKDAAASLER